MTLAQLHTEMSSAEFELWMALAMVREDECPRCGVEPREMMNYKTAAFTCPVCGWEGERVRRLRSERAPNRERE